MPGSSEKCVECGHDTSFGSGRFVNRVPADDGYLCAECLVSECDHCGKEVGCDEDNYTDDGSHVCLDCFDRAGEEEI